ncbi:hypothetical protein OCO53_00275 [Peribacillus frigoritolerans]|nr:hypothetical protein [Peribacillus frigoritolerans]MCU6598913.1 hypothetical protein [Peribacillus frigoritolerans]
MIRSNDREFVHFLVSFRILLVNLHLLLVSLGILLVSLFIDNS